MNLWVIFLTGLTTGGLTCLAVQGGLLAATIAQNDNSNAPKALPVAAFLIAKLAAYTVLGLLLGVLGSIFQLSITVQIILNTVAALFMIGAALNLLNIHPLFRYFLIQPPKRLQRLVRNQSKSKSIFAPALLGVFTIFIPCGTTQAMEILAISSGSAMAGASILFSFVLGTFPIFFALGLVTAHSSRVLGTHFEKITAAILIILGLFSLDSALSLTGTSYTLRNAVRNLNCTISFCRDSNVLAAQSDGKEKAVIEISEKGYTPNTITIHRNSQVELKLVNRGGGGCASAFTIPQLGIQKVIPIGGSESVAFVAPGTPGTVRFTCSMGMVSGEFKVI